MIMYNGPPNLPQSLGWLTSANTYTYVWLVSFRAKIAKTKMCSNYTVVTSFVF